jgi:hypothetical protein
MLSRSGNKHAERGSEERADAAPAVRRFRVKMDRRGRQASREAAAMNIDGLKHYGILGILTVVLLSACTDSPPAMGSHLPGSFSEASDAFDERVKGRFPVGSDETALRAELAREKFVVSADKDSPSGFVARYHADELVCGTSWVIRWSVAEAKVATIGGSYREVCL